MVCRLGKPLPASMLAYHLDPQEYNWAFYSRNDYATNYESTIDNKNDNHYSQGPILLTGLT